MKFEKGDLVRQTFMNDQPPRPYHPWWYDISPSVLGIVVGKGARCEPVVCFLPNPKLFWMKDGELELVSKSSTEM